MREKRSRNQEKPEPLFDYKLDDFDFQKPLSLCYDGIDEDTISALAESAKGEAEEFQAQSRLLDSPEVPYVPPLPISKADPLKPDLFVGHHRRMEREERRMQVQEKQQLTVMAAKIRAQKDVLMRPDWRGGIEKIVRIKDAANGAEVKKKRELALREMESFLTKFEEYNRRCNRREVKQASVDLKKKKHKTAPKETRAKSKTQPSEPELPESKDLIISIRPMAFGYMVPPRVFPPREFALPQLLITEVESYDLIDELARDNEREH